MTVRGKLFVTVGLPGSGKTTRAKELAAEHAAVRLTPDEWMIPLFDHNDAEGKRDVLEGRFVWLAMSALEQGVNVVLDFGVWAKDERSALKHLALKLGAECELVYTPIDHDEQLRRVGSRFTTAPETTFVITEDDLAQWREQFEEPDQQELLSPEPGPVPDGFPSWDAWTARRWPTSLDVPPAEFEPRIRPARDSDLAQLPVIERAAGAPFRAIGMDAVADDAPPTVDELRPYAAAGRAWVATDAADAPVGYLIARVVDNGAHIEQVSILPLWSGRGIGRRLIEQAVAWAAEQGHQSVTLTTFTDVPWNGPYYRRLGFEYMDDVEVGPELRGIRADEAGKGLDAWPRACMRRAL